MSAKPDQIVWDYEMRQGILWGVAEKTTDRLVGQLAPEEMELIKALGRCRFGIGSPEKRFIGRYADAVKFSEAFAEQHGCRTIMTMSERQRAWVYGLAWKYRRQLRELAR